MSDNVVFPFKWPADCGDKWHFMSMILTDFGKSWLTVRRKAYFRGKNPAAQTYLYFENMQILLEEPEKNFGCDKHWY